MSARLLRAMRPLGRAVRWLWLAAGMALVLAAAAEWLLDTGARMVADQRVKSRVRSTTAAQAPAQGDAAWIDDYLEEVREAFRLESRPYVGWTAQPYRGNAINIDRDGLRATWQPAPRGAAAGAPYEILMLGGSTTWGMLARDEHTIASALARRLDAAGARPVRVVNGGQLAYVSTQEVLALLFAIRDGRPPDLVIFLDGINDMLSTLQNGAAGQPMRRMAWYPQMFSRRGEMTQRVLEVHYGNSSLSVVSDFLLVNLAGADFVAADDVPRLAAATVDTYLANVRLVEQWAAAAGFAARFYWQPSVFTKSPHSPLEAAIAASYSRSMQTFFVEVERQLAARDELAQAEHFSDLKDVFDDRPETIFLDYCHLTEAANERIAERIAADVAPRLAAHASAEDVARPPATRSGVTTLDSDSGQR